MTNGDSLETDISNFLRQQREMPNKILQIEEGINRLFPQENFGVLPALREGELKLDGGELKIFHPRSFPRDFKSTPPPYFQAGDCTAIIADILDKQGVPYAVYEERIEFELPKEGLTEKWQHYFIRLDNGDELDPTPFGEKRIGRKQPKRVSDYSVKNNWGLNQKSLSIEQLVPLSWIPLNKLEAIFIRGGICPSPIPVISRGSNLPPEAISFEVFISHMRSKLGGWKPEETSIATIKIPLGGVGRIQNQVKGLNPENFLDSPVFSLPNIGLHLNALNDDRFDAIDRKTMKDIFYLLISKIPANELGLWRPQPTSL